jgi:transposase
LPDHNLDSFPHGPWEGRRGRSGFDAGNLIKGKERHILVDTLGLLLHAIIHARWRPAAARHAVRQVSVPSEAVADSAYQGPIFADGLAKILPYLQTEIVKRPDQTKGFVQLPKRWIVERSIAWLNRCRRLAKDWENLNCSGRQPQSAAAASSKYVMRPSESVTYIAAGSASMSCQDAIPVKESIS